MISHLSSIDQLTQLGYASMRIEGRELQLKVGDDQTYLIQVTALNELEDVANDRVLRRFGCKSSSMREKPNNLDSPKPPISVLRLNYDQLGIA